MGRLDTTIADVEAAYGHHPAAVEDFRLLAHASPGVLAGYMDLRRAGLSADDSQAHLPKHIRELIAIGMELAAYKHNPPPRGHAVSAVNAGATVEEVAEVVGIAIGLCGMMSYRESGRFVLEAAEQRARELQEEREESAGQR